ncbi:MAG: hypothetical protein KBD66_03920, partial [Candidatus Doudnabacteria bacterium]|nr:hypothetical protein [Candidatus Doudnabacteria bacterium]
LALFWCKKLAHELDHAYMSKEVFMDAVRQFYNAHERFHRTVVRTGGALENGDGWFFEEMGATHLDYSITRNELIQRYPHDWEYIRQNNTLNLPEDYLHYAVDIDQSKSQPIALSGYQKQYERLKRRQRLMPELFSLILEARIYRDYSKLQVQWDEVFGAGSFKKELSQDPGK